MNPFRQSNFSTPCISVLLGVPKITTTLNDALSGDKHVSEVAYMHPSGLKIIPLNISYHETRNINPEKFHDVLLDVVGSTEIGIIDTAPGIGKEAGSTLYRGISRILGGGLG